MIIVEKSKKNISIKGHALYNDFGRDIVCSAVSSIVITSINGILGIDKDSIKVDNKEYHFENLLGFAEKVKNRW